MGHKEVERGGGGGGERACQGGGGEREPRNHASLLLLVTIMVFVFLSEVKRWHFGYTRRRVAFLPNLGLTSPLPIISGLVALSDSSVYFLDESTPLGRRSFVFYYLNHKNITFITSGNDLCGASTSTSTPRTVSCSCLSPLSRRRSHPSSHYFIPSSSSSSSPAHSPFYLLVSFPREGRALRCCCYKSFHEMSLLRLQLGVVVLDAEPRQVLRLVPRALQGVARYTEHV
jgi:hypothetical protein